MKKSRLKLQTFAGSIATALALLAIQSMAAAATVDYSFNSVAVTSPATGVTVAGSAPWLNLQISDTTPGTVQFTVSTDLVKSTANQTLTGLWLNIPSIANTVGTLTISGTGNQNPFSFSTSTGNFSNSSTTQSIAPSGEGGATGYSNIYLKFSNSSNPIQGVETDTFNLSGTGLTAASFFATSAQTSGGTPSSSGLYALASLANAGATAGSGIAYLAATPVPLPAALPLLLSGLGMLGFGRRKSVSAT